jgi:hypothetical protein
VIERLNLIIASSSPLGHIVMLVPVRQHMFNGRFGSRIEGERAEGRRDGDGDNGERVLGKVECVLLLGRSSNLLSLPLLVGGLGVVANEVELPAGGWGGYAIVYGTFDDGVIIECNVCKG